MARMRPIEHEDECSLVEHLGELRTRIIIALAAFGVALGLCFWQNHPILRLMNAPLGGGRPITLSQPNPPPPPSGWRLTR